MNAGMLFQKSELLEHLTAYENVIVPALLAKLPPPEKKHVNDAFRDIGLAGKLDRYPSELSGGERARVSFLRATLSGGGMLFADEPTSELDTKNAHLLMTLLKKEQDMGRTIFFITHDGAMAKYADQSYVIDPVTHTLCPL